MKTALNLQNFQKQLFPIQKLQIDDHLSNENRSAGLFIFVILFYIFFQLAMQPNWVTGGEMWAEMATNYYPNANSSSYLQKLFSTDAGYIPAPQRLIALIGTLLNFPAKSIPYFYTWSSIIFTGMLVGTFCLPQFRKVIKSDYLRLFTSIAILLVADFETRTFINFTYFAAFFVAIITALALVDDSKEIPWWAWLIPLLMVSKPAVLAALPAMILAACVSRLRFRLIVLFSLIFCAGQFLQMFISSSAGTMPTQINDISFISKLLAILKYFLGLLALYLIGPAFKFHQLYLILVGSFFLLACAYLIIYKRSNSNALILVGISLLFFNVFINVFALTDSWNINTDKLQNTPVYRHIIVGFFGCVLVLSGVISSTLNTSTALSLPFLRGIGAFVFAIWFLGSGWLNFAGKISREPVSPTINNSQWQAMATAIDAGLSPVCVPINPWWKGANWIYQRNCVVLKAPPAWEDGSIVINGDLEYQISPPKALVDKKLVATAILVKPLGNARSFVEILMHIKLKDGNTMYFSGSNNFNSSGGLLMLVGAKSVAVNEIAGITLKFGVPVEVALDALEPSTLPGIAWLGH
jgi:hypothetical protein